MESNGNNILWPILAGVLIILANAFFVMVEFAIVTVRKGQMDRLAEEGHAGAAAASRLLRDPDWAIAGSQLGITLASILLGIVAEEPLLHLLEPALTRIFGSVPWLSALAGGLATILVLLLLSFFHMVLGEQTPKTIALRFPARVAVIVAPPMLLFARLAHPLVWLVDKSTAAVLKVLGIGGQTGGHGIHTAEELKEVVLESQEEGVIPYADQQMLLRAMDFGGRFVREAMIPRPDIVAVEKTATLGELLRVFKTSRHSRFPVYENDFDNISGTISVKEVLPLLADDPSAVDRPLSELDLIRPALVVPESRRIGDLFNQMRKDREHMAIVLDEFGGTAGLVTAEELAEEVVGRLTDEWVTEGPQVKTVKENVFEIDAQTRVDEVNEGLALSLPTSPDYETLAGFVLFHIRRIPKQGDVITYDTPGSGPNLRITITKMIGPKIERIQVERL
jgi:CBS domain containing-hemolysin-like protein